MEGVSKKAIIFLLSVTIIPFMLGLIGLMIYSGYCELTDKRTGKEQIIDYHKPDDYRFKIDTIFNDSRNHNAYTLSSKKRRIKVSPLREDEWEKYVEVGDSILKIKGDTKIYVYRKDTLYKILDYNDMNPNRWQ
ncbi:hypothetical protein ATE49_15685 [Elizabethkingia miricola]|nr:hypothetical protein ATE49_15685 [Elizabethkingia miricola]